MALGVLNNLSAIYAENNLNNTNNSLQTVLQQLSSGSKINSGADDAAGLSLINGLEANSTALTQSTTNATEGVGLLQVADGALSQVTSLLDRAVTLATEASNGTLNASQDAAANQEYQSILSEINNIGSTTTYNQVQVFTGDQAGVAIYTGDSSASGSSLDSLVLRQPQRLQPGRRRRHGAAEQRRPVRRPFQGHRRPACHRRCSGYRRCRHRRAHVHHHQPDGTTSTVTTTATTVSGLIAEINSSASQA